MPISSRESSRAHSDAPAVVLRPLSRADRVPGAHADRDAIEKILRATKAFREDEIVVAMELIDADASEGYRFVVAEIEGTVAGYACYGATPMTIGTWDLYWIAVDPERHGRGIGRALLSAAEDAVRADGGRMMLIETGGKPSYAPTREVYLKCGYREVARVPDFYERGDDKVVYMRSLR